jgi:anti-repressor protein
MNELQKFNFEGNDLAVKEIEGQVYFNAEQAAIGLGLFEKKNGKVYVRWRNVSKYLSQEVAKGDFITEPQFYKFAIKANNPVAEKFQDWVTDEVLPAIRKHGAYMTDEKAFDVVHNASGLADLLQQAADQLKAKDIQIAERKPKALFTDSVAVL